MKILIVDDSILVRRSMVKLLDQLDRPIKIVEAVNVPEGIRLMNEYQPDIAIIDIKMPGGSGFDVLKAAKKLEKPPVTIMLSKFTTTKFKAEAVSEGADYFFGKSTEVEKVVEIIEKHSNS